MKRLAALLACCLLLPAFTIRAQAMSRTDITAQSAVLMDFDTGQILFDKNMDRRAYPASTTKIMTGLLAMEECYPAETVTVTESAVDIGVAGSSNVALIPGEEMPLDEAMYALMLPSANDAANVIAEHVAGSQEEFARMMTEKARQIGAVNTNFTNAHGLHDSQHYTTARDMAIITRYAAGDQMFMRYFGADLHTMPATNKQSEERPFTNYQYMLVKTTQYYNEDVIGGKVGFTNEAKHTMSTIATRDGRTLIAVVMGCGRNEKFTDTQALLDFGFDEFTKVTIPKEEAERFVVPIREGEEQIGDALLTANSDISFLIHNSVDPGSVQCVADIPEAYGPEDAISATMNLVADAEEEAIPSLLASKPMTVKKEMTAVPASASLEEDKAGGLSLPLPAVIIAVSLIFLLISVFCLSRYRRYQRRKARIARRNRQMRAAGRQQPSRAPVSAGARARSHSYGSMR